MENNEVRFEVLKIERANKPGHVVVTLKFKNSEKLFTYVRKMYVQNGIGIVVIDGCHVNFTLYEYKLINIVKKYETKGMHKAKGGTSDKIKTKSEGKLEGIMPVKEQIPTEKYRVNDKIRAYILDVERGIKGAPQVIVSRAHNDFVRKLFELEIPEIYEGLIEIKGVSRDPGNRCKVAVYSQNENIDPVGSCVGQKGIRIQNIINELHGEKIDVIEWSEDPAIYISAALLPAEVMAVDVKPEEKFAQVIVRDDQLSLAIGKSGQNARLAARLTNWKIDIKSESQFREMLANLNENAEIEGSEEQEENSNEE